MAGERIDVEIEFTGLAPLARVLGSPRAVMDGIGSYLVASTLRRFASERGPDGKPWLRSARALAEGRRTLTRSGRLRRSITHVVASDGHAVEVGSDVAYAAVHQFGGRAGRGGKVAFPARPYLGIDERDRAAIRRIVRRAIEGAAT